MLRQVQESYRYIIDHSESKSDEHKEEIVSADKEESKRSNKPWTEEEDKLLFQLYKEKGSVWSVIARCFPGRTENNLKNRFYSTLRRIARKKTKGVTNSDPVSRISQSILDYVDEALESGHSCFSKRGRPKKVVNISEKEIKVEPFNPPPFVSQVPQPPSMVLNNLALPQEERSLNLLISRLPPPCAKADVELSNKLVELVNLQQTIIDLLLARSGGARQAHSSLYQFPNNI